MRREEQLLQHVDVLDDRGHHIEIKSESLFQLLKDANEVEHKSERLNLSQRECG